MPLKDRDTSRDEWFDTYAEFPRLVLGLHGRHPTTHRPALLCLDCAKSGEPVLTGDQTGELANCAGCDKALRHAANFGSLHEGMY